MNTKSWLLIVSMMLMVACHKGGNAQVADIPMVKIDTVGTTTGESTLQFPGKVVASQQVNASFRVAGTLKRVCVEEGSRAKAGQLLAEMDATDYKVQLEATEAEYAQVKAEAERVMGLYADSSTTANLYDKARYGLKQMEAKLQNHRNQLAYTRITSPIDGVVLSKAVEEGQTVAASFNTPELFTIAQDLTKMQVIADIDEADIGDVHDGARVEFTVDAFPDDTFTGIVTQVRQEATTESNVVTYEVVISAENNDLKLKPGLTANVTIYTKEAKDVLSVPTKALQFTPNEKMLTKEQSIQDCEGKTKVWVLQDNVFKAIPVTTGISNGIMTEIKAGVKAGQKIVTDFSMANSGNEEGKAGNDNPFMPKPPSSKKDKKN